MSLIRRHKLIFTEGLLTLLLAVFIGLCVGGRVREDVALPDLEAAVLAKIRGAEHMKVSGAMKLKALYDLNANDFSDFILYIPASNMDAQEMLLIRCENEPQTESVAAAMRRRIEDQKEIFESYGMEQMALIRQAAVDVQGLYCFYLCDPDPGPGQSAFRSLLRER
ncbi:MAG: DUF4358 domain-containing protein [Lachnospiraceae bacterium]|nr:DUF4358 domain-containing protein [Lachnospiraceae bacterium]